MTPLQELLSLLAPEYTAHLAGPALYAALALIGGIIGFLVGVFGVGGGFLIVPLVNVIVGVSYEIAVGSSVAMIVGTGTTGILRHRERRTVNPKIATTIATGSIVGAVIGDRIQTLLKDLLAGPHVAAGAIAASGAPAPTATASAATLDGFTIAMHSLFILLLAAAAYLTVRDPVGKPPRVSPASPESRPPTSIARSTPILLAIGLATGILTGLLGIGGGVLLVPILIGIVGLKEQKAAGTSLAIVFVTAVVATFQKTLLAQAKMSLPVTLALLISGVIGVQIGIHLAGSITRLQFRRGYLAVIASAVLVIAFDLIF